MIAKVTKEEIGRRRFLTAAAGFACSTCTAPAFADSAFLTSAIPSSGERLPVIGMGSWITFNVGSDEKLRAGRLEVLKSFFTTGGALIDSSPMYGSSEDVIGYCLKRIADRQALFAATKVWTLSKWLGVRQMEESERLWGQARFDLMQIHNLLDWETHLETLNEWKAGGRLRYSGITTSHGRRHRELAEIISKEPFDFVQFTYNIADREAEKRLLPLAAERGIAVIANRPFRRGELPDRLSRHPLPAWAGEIDCGNWPQFLLKFIVSHPAVTCAIPATSRVEHMRENMGACRGRLPDAAMRKRMISHVEDL
jgi:diketogulonate reductase-like aldo/keto reductase